MTRLALKLGLGFAAALVLAGGIAGAYSYAHDYDLHRGFSTLVQLRRAGTGRLEAVHFYSPALHRRTDYLVYLPPGYNAHRRYPVYYLLHGMPGQPKVFVDIANMDVRLDNQLSLGGARPMLLVYPDGRVDGSVFSDSEWANTSAGNYESYVIDVMKSVDQRFSTRPRRQDRVIAGFSSGAYGAINVALHHLQDFASVQTWSGYFTQTRTGVFAHARTRALSYNSPLDYVTSLRHEVRAHPIRVYMFVGRADGVSRQQLPMVEALRAAGAEVAYHFYGGGHDWSVWYPRLNQMLDLAAAEVSHPPIVAPATIPAAPATVAINPVPQPRHQRSELRLVLALLLALLSAALINLGFVLQHKGQARAGGRGRGVVSGAMREPTWLIGQGVGWIGFAGQIVAVALAPLTLVQAFSAGSLALSVPLAARLLSYRVTRRQLVAIVVIAASLATLPLGFEHTHGHLQPGLLILAALPVMLIGGLIVPGASAAACAIAAGALYGVADAGIKAASIALRFHGVGVLNGWTLLAGLCTFGGFLVFQAALRQGDAVQSVSLMNAFTALAAATLGIVAFGEALGSSVVASVVHAAAILAVLACVPSLAGAQQEMLAPGDAIRVNAGDRVRGGVPGAKPIARALAAVVLGATALLLCALAALGLLYELRQLRWFAVGPPIPDALPLLQLAGFAAQPLARVLAAALLAGLALGLALVWIERGRRIVFVGVFALLLILVSSDASYAVARNVPLHEVLVDRAPGLGAWLEALLLVIGSALPGRVDRVHVPAWALRLRDSRILAPALTAAVALVVVAAIAFPSGPAHAQPPRVRVASATPVMLTATPRPAASRPAPRPKGVPQTHRRQARPATGRLLSVWFYSEALHKVADYLVYLPAAYNPARRLPVFYMLHGMPGRPLAFTANAFIEGKIEALIRRHRIAPMILVFPDGRIDRNTQTDSEWANTRAGRYESYVVDVLHDVDHRFATLPYRQDRAIAGLSAGAYGAINVGLHQVSLFGLIQVWSGYFIETRTGVFAHARIAQLDYNSPLDYARRMGRRLAYYPLHVFLYVGRDDSDRRQIVPMARALAADGIDAGYAIYSGGHSWDLWAPRIDRMLLMANRSFAPAATAG